MTKVQADTDYPCPWCGEQPEIVVRDDGKCGIYCAGEQCLVTLEIRNWFVGAQEAEQEWDHAMGSLADGGFRFE